VKDECSSKEDISHAAGGGEDPAGSPIIDQHSDSRTMDDASAAAELDVSHR
jgi:hypothetical protein